jgi:O-antigen ligase
VALVVTLMAALGRRAWLPLGGIAAAGAVTLPLLLQSARFARLLDPTEGTNFFRLRVWQSAVAMIRDAPLTGLGQDQFLRVFRGRYILPDAWQEPNLSHPHNIVLDFWLRLGVLGVVLGVALHVVLARLLVRGLALARTQGATLRAAIAVGALGCLANQIAHGMVDNSLFVNDLVYVFVLLAGLGMYLSQQNKH